MTPKLLIQSYYFPPIRVVGAHRLYQVYRESQAYFAQIREQTTANRHAFPRDPGLELPEAAVTEIPTRDLRTRLAQQGQAGVHLDFRVKTKPWGRSLRRLYHSYPFLLWVGDGGVQYRRTSIQRAQHMIEKESITHLFSSFRPWSDHLVAARLKRKYPQLVWVADLRDLPVDPIRQDVLWPARQTRWMQHTLGGADRIVTVSEGLADQLRSSFREVKVVYNGLAGAPQQWMTAPQSPAFTISYTGSLYPQLQSVAPLFRCLRALLNEQAINPVHLQLQYAGKDRYLWREWTRKYGLGHLSVDYGEVDWKTARELQANSQMNLLLSWSAKGYGGILTAKLSDYLAAGRPIIALLNGPPDPELSRWVEQTGAGKVFTTPATPGSTQVRDFVLDAYRTWAFAGALPWQIQASSLEPFTWQQQAQTLWEGLV